MKKDFISDESIANELNFKKLKAFLRFVKMIFLRSENELFLLYFFTLLFIYYFIFTLFFSPLSLKILFLTDFWKIQKHK